MGGNDPEIGAVIGYGDADGQGAVHPIEGFVKEAGANGVDVGRHAEVDGAFKVLAVPTGPFAVVGLGVAAGQ